MINTDIYYVMITMYKKTLCTLQRKCELYWPEKEPKTYGDISVKPLEIENTSDFCVRNFELTKVCTSNPIQAFV